MIITYRFHIQKTRTHYRIIRTTLYNGKDPTDALGRTMPQTQIVYSIASDAAGAEDTCKIELNRRQQMRR